MANRLSRCLKPTKLKTRCNQSEQEPRAVSDLSEEILSQIAGFPVIQRRISMPDNYQCRECGERIPQDAPSSLCPHCLLALGLAAGEAEDRGQRSEVRGQRSEVRGEGKDDGKFQSGPPSSINPQPGPTGTISRSFGDYELQEEIGRGSMGVVYKARKVSRNRIVAVKIIASGRLASETEIKRFHDEAAAWAILDHPNIVPLYESGEHAGQYFLSMGLIEGTSLAVAADSRQSAASATGQNAAALCREAATLLATVARAVHYAHQRRLLHGDLKPSNILVDTLGEPHVTDFGLARRVEVDSGSSDSLRLIARLGGTSPEQALGRDKDLTTATDVWGLGATLYFLITGRPPFQKRTEWETLNAVLAQEPDRPRLLNRRVDCDLEAICLKCLEKDPTRRYATADALAEDLLRWLSGKAILFRPVTRRDRIRKWAIRHPAIAGLIAALALVFVLGGTTAIWRWQKYEEGARARRQGVSQRVMLGLEAFLLNPQSNYYTISSVDRRIMSGEWPFKDKLDPPSRPHLVFAVYTHSEPINMLGRFRALLDYLEPKLATPIDFRIYKSYSNAVNDLVGGKVDCMWLGPASYVQARERNRNLVLLAQQLHKGTNRMYGVVFTRVGSTITNLPALANHIVAFGDPDSTFGSVLARAEFVKAGIYATNLVGHRHFASHPAVVQAVLSDTNIAAGFANLNAVAKAIADGKVTVMKTMQSVTFPWVANTNRQPATVLKIRNCLLQLRDLTVLTNIDRDLTGFQPGRAEDYDPLESQIKAAVRFER